MSNKTKRARHKEYKADKKQIEDPVKRKIPPEKEDVIRERKKHRNP
jgi:hypothetical protein